MTQRNPQQSKRRPVSDWASPFIERLLAGEAVTFRPRGHSMRGKINSGQRCTVAPVDATTLVVGDVVLCTVRGASYLHLVKAIDGQRYQIGNTRGRLNGWIGPTAIFGKLTTVED